MDVEDVDRALAFMARPESREIGEKAGVIDGAYWFLEPARPLSTLLVYNRRPFVLQDAL